MSTSKVGGAQRTDVVTPRLSASLIVIKPLQSTTPDGFNYHTLLLQRDATRGSFLSAHVFPGGNIDSSDKSDVWNTICPNEDDEATRALKICAIRETFEECGLLISTSDGNSSLSPEPRNQWRTDVHRDAALFAKLFEALSGRDSQVRPALDQLAYRGNFITPRTLSKRWDTHFYITVLPPTERKVEDNSESVPDVSSDGTEMVSAIWLTPLEAIRRATLSPTSPEFIICGPPQCYFLSELVSKRNWQDLLQTPVSLQSLRPRPRRVILFEPEIKKLTLSDGRKCSATVLPGDPYHSTTSAMQPQPSAHAIHRTYVQPPDHSRNPGGLRVLGVRRKGIQEILGAEYEDMASGEVFESMDISSKL